MAVASVTLAEVQACGHVNKNYQDTRSLDKHLQLMLLLQNEGNILSQNFFRRHHMNGEVAISLTYMFYISDPKLRAFCRMLTKIKV